MLKKINKLEFEQLCKNGQILQSDYFGPKVWLLPQGRVLKTFRRKQLVSSQIWMPYAIRFARNADLLQKRGIPTVRIESTFQVPEIGRQAVLYELMQGQTLREWITAQDKTARDAMLEKLGDFVAELHHKGILFRSLHLGNVLLMDNGKLGLIDISDMAFRWWGPLSNSQRIRNFHHMDRYDGDRIALTGEGGQHFIHAYLKAAALKEHSQRILRDNYEAIFAKYADLQP